MVVIFILGKIWGTSIPLFDRIDKNFIVKDGRVLISSLHPGFWNPALREEAFGLDLNPAFYSDRGIFLLTYGFSSSIPIETDIDLFLSNLLDTFYIPLDMSFSLKSMSGFEGIACIFPIGKWNFSIGSFKDIDLGLDAYGEMNDFIEIDSTLHITRVLTHDDIPQIPEGDSIPIEFQMEGTIKTSFLTNVHFRLNTLPLFLAISRRYGKTDLGVGIKMNYIESEGWGIFDLNADSASFNLIATSSEWDVEDFSIILNFPQENKKFTSLSGRWSSSGFIWGLVAGVRTNFRNLNIGISIGWSEGFKFRGNYKAITRTPDFYEESWDYDSLFLDSLNVDTSQKVISGRGMVYLPGFDLEEEHLKNNRIYSVGRTFSVSIGVSYRGIGVGLGGKLSLSGEIKNNEYFVSPSLYFDLFPHFKGGVIPLLLIREIEIDGKNILIPNFNLGFSLSYFCGIKPFERIVAGLNLIGRPPTIRGYYKAGDWKENIEFSKIAFIPSFRFGITSNL